MAIGECKDRAMQILLVTHESSFHHDSGPNHPERPQRLAAVVEGVESAGFDVIRTDAPLVERDELARVHEGRYIDAVEQFCANGGGYLDADTHAGAESWEAALRSAGAGGAAIAALEEGDADVAFIATRPPGHHALPARAMGFCLFNNVAVAAASLTARGHRVAVLDWDVHHGNGTQDMFYEDPSVLYISLHESPMYPGTGRLEERGAGRGVGTTFNIPLPGGTAGDVYLWLIEHVVRPAVVAFEPDWLLVSAGYDAHRSDPLAGIRLEAGDYGAITGAMRGVVAPSRTVFLLEGGYDLDALAHSSAATVRGHLGVVEPGSVADGSGHGPSWDAARRAREKLNGELG